MKICAKCKLKKKDSEFYRYPGTGKLHSYCFECKAIWHTQREAKHPGNAAERQKRYRDKHPERERGNVYRWREKNREVVNLLHRQWSVKNRSGYKRKIRDAVFEAYGGAKCACCGETQIMFLTIDHMNNDGAQHRRLLGGASGNIYAWLHRNRFPPGFQVLCRNCNWGKHVNGGVCPHCES